MDDSTLEFQYLIAASPPFLVVSFVGQMNKDHLNKMEQCEREIFTHENLKYIILYFRDVPNVTMDAIPFLTSLQMKIRTSRQLKICSLKPELKEKLNKLGVIRASELCNNLQEALQLLKHTQKKE